MVWDSRYMTRDFEDRLRLFLGGGLIIGTVVLAIGLLLLFAGCRQPDRAEWSGIPAARACVWQDDKRQASCVAEGKVYLCIYVDLDGRPDKVICAPDGVPNPVEKQ